MENLPRPFRSVLLQEHPPGQGKAAITLHASRRKSALQSLRKGSIRVFR
jgi:hypothetical protein